MNVTISSCKAFHGCVIEFEKAILGPKIEYFQSRSYGSSIESLMIVFELQNPKRTLRHHSRFFREERHLYYHIVLADELELESDLLRFRAIAVTMQAVLKKSFKKIKGEDFDSSLFETELMAYLAERIEAAERNGWIRF